MTAGRPERGAISFSGVVSLLVFGAGIFLGLKLLPPYISNYELEDSLNKIAMAASYTPMSEDEIRKGVLSRANGYGINVPLNAISVAKEADSVTITVRYIVPVDLFLKKLDLQ